MKTKYLIFIIFSIILSITTFLGCIKHDIEKGTPKCVVSKIKDFNKSSICDNPNVKEYTFQGKTVYVFDPGTCGNDFSSEVIDSDCNSLGYLGGFNGNTKINGEEFSNAIFIKITWEK